ESIERSAGSLPHEVEVILVDNASADGTVETVRARFPAVRMIANDVNVGFPKANNQALPLARGEYVLFLNPDSELAPGTLECLLGAAMLCRTEQVRALGGFDESVPLYLDDMDLCRRLGDLGRLRYLSGVPLLHHYSVSARKQPTALMKRLGLQATYQYFVKHRGRRYARAYVVIVASVGLASFPLGFVRLLGGSLKKARRRWDEARVFVDWAWRS